MSGKEVTMIEKWFSGIYEEASSNLKYESFKKRVQFIVDKIYKEDRTGDLSKEVIERKVVTMLYLFHCCDEFESNVLRTILNYYGVYGKW